MDLQDIPLADGWFAGGMTSNGEVTAMWYMPDLALQHPN